MRLNNNQLDVFREITEIGSHLGIKALSCLLKRPVHAQIPSVHLGQWDGTTAHSSWDSWNRQSGVEIDFSGALSGTVKWGISWSDAARLLESMNFHASHEDQEDMFREVGNMMLNGLIGCLANMLHIRLHLSPPRFICGEGDAEEGNWNGNSLLGNHPIANPRPKLENHHALLSHTMFLEEEGPILGCFFMALNRECLPSLSHGLEELLDTAA